MISVLAAFISGVSVGVSSMAVAGARRRSRELARAEQAVAGVRGRLDAANAKVDAFLTKSPRGMQ